MENKYPESVGTNAMQISGSRVTLAAEAGAVEKMRRRSRFGALILGGDWSAKGSATGDVQTQNEGLGQKIRVDGTTKNTLEYEIVQVVDTGPILRDMAFSVDHEHLYIMSEKQKDILNQQSEHLVNTLLYFSLQCKLGFHLCLGGWEDLRTGFLEVHPPPFNRNLWKPILGFGNTFISWINK
ncbi:hypothetical protein TURU_108550 [Turdus rufiventris]|nr:hypothetical protein TURU_108550 [Turdus rufiventris]